jgi:hypothetical protein
MARTASPLITGWTLWCLVASLGTGCGEPVKNFIDTQCWFADITGTVQVPMYIRSPTQGFDSRRRRRALLVDPDVVTFTPLDDPFDLIQDDWADDVVRITNGTDKDPETTANEVAEVGLNVVNGYDDMMDGVGLDSTGSRVGLAVGLMATGPVGMVIGGAIIVFEILCAFFCDDDAENKDILEAQQYVLDAVKSHIRDTERVKAVIQVTSNAAKLLLANTQRVQKFAQSLVREYERVGQYIVERFTVLRTMMQSVGDVLTATEARLAAQRVSTYQSIQRVRYNLQVETNQRRHDVAVARQKFLVDLEMTGIPLRVKNLRLLVLIRDRDPTRRCNADIQLLPDSQHTRNLARTVLQGLYRLQYVPSRPTAQGTVSRSYWYVLGLICDMHLLLWMTDSVYSGSNALWDYIVMRERSRCYEYTIPYVDSAGDRGGEHPYSSREAALGDAEANFQRLFTHFADRRENGDNTWLMSLLAVGVSTQNPVRVPQMTSVPPGPMILWPGHLEVVVPASDSDPYLLLTNEDGGENMATAMAQTVYHGYYDPLLAVPELTLRLKFERPVLNEATKRLLLGDFALLAGCYGPHVPMLILKRADGLLLFDYAQTAAWTRQLTVVHASPLIHRFLAKDSRAVGWEPRSHTARTLMCPTGGPDLVPCSPETKAREGLIVRYCDRHAFRGVDIGVQDVSTAAAQTNTQDMRWNTYTPLRFDRSVRKMRVRNASLSGASVTLGEALGTAAQAQRAFVVNLDTETFQRETDESSLSLDGLLLENAALQLEVQIGRNETKRLSEKARRKVQDNIDKINLALNNLPVNCGLFGWVCAIDEYAKSAGGLRELVRLFYNGWVLACFLGLGVIVVLLVILYCPRPRCHCPRWGCCCGPHHEYALVSDGSDSVSETKSHTTHIISRRNTM